MTIRKKKMLLCISNAGSEGKTTIAKAIKETLIHNSISHSTYLCDKDHIELLKTYGSEVTIFDIRQDKDTLINALGDDVEIILVDFPAASIDELTNVFGSMQTFIDSFGVFEAVPVFIIPVVSDKSIQSIDRLSALLEGVQGGFEFVFVLNEGLMTSKDAVHLAFNNNQSVQTAISNGKAKTVTISTKFTPAFSELVKTQRLRQALTQKLNPMEKVLLMDFLKKTDQQFCEVFGFKSVSTPTALETIVKANTKAK